MFTRKEVETLPRWSQFIMRYHYFVFSVNLCSMARLRLGTNPDAMKDQGYEVIIGDSVSVTESQV